MASDTEIVPYHLGKHKPVARKRAAFPPKLRLQVAGTGAAAVLLGVYRLWRGVLLVENTYAIPLASEAVIALGGIFILFALIPVRCIESTASWLLCRDRASR